jgi:hypothetical protein
MKFSSLLYTLITGSSVLAEVAMKFIVNTITDIMAKIIRLKSCTQKGKLF